MSPRRHGAITSRTMATMRVMVEQVRKVYANGVEALREVSFGVARGEFLSLLGPSGCGKSTLLLIAAGLLPPTSGRIVIDGGCITGPSRDVGLVFQSPLLLPWRTVLDNVLFPVEMLGLRRRDYQSRAWELLELVGLHEFASSLPRELSGGMQQLVSICRGRIPDRGLVLRDEPFSALDALTRDHMGLELQRIWDHDRKTVVFVTHSVREAVFLSDRVLVMTRRPATIVHEARVML